MLFRLDDGIQSIIMSDQYRMDDRIIYILYYTIGLYIRKRHTSMMDVAHYFNFYTYYFAFKINLF